MKKLFLLTLLLFSVTVVFAQRKKSKGVQVSKVETSDIRWWGYKVVKSEATSHTGFVKLKSGKFYFTDKVLTGGDFVINMRSLTNTDLTGEDQQKLTEHLRSSDFFEVKRYPVAKFTITKILPSKNLDYNYLVYGNLTLKGIRRTISFPANIRTNDRFVSFESAKITLDRQKYKVFYKSAVRDYLIKDDIDIQIKMTAN
ncbi:YceI family protein [Chryseobacterium lacus]|mgnify:FL=1|uniref:YceI family protein n=1 Tax=Chryseobacterium lacus TaxID=2058346 RepID=UPI00086D8240|nr:YceI family protein [Chryseobacterium lacus]MBF6610279.1 YceI family protein [Chryseobacterium sp.]ODS87987.1 MAG: lipid-binding protein [Chryseobacterium sp. SCN 40-13]RST25899.1 YceI family protein [Chryseobacterium lacus]